MAITDNKITTGEVNSNHVKNAPNVLTGTAQTNKNYFDKLPELIVSKHNNLIDDIGTDKQDTLVSGTNIKTVNSTSLLGSGDVAVQPTLVSGTNIKTINNNSILGSGNMSVGEGKATGNARIFYGTCDTAANVDVKEVTCSAYDALTTGDIIVVTFANANTHDHYYLTLKVGSTAQKRIKYFHNGDLYDVPKTSIKGTCVFVYDGTYWVLQSVDTNTTYNVPYWRDARIEAGETSVAASSDSSGSIAYTAYIIHEGANNEEVAIDFEFDVISHLAIWSIASPIDDDIHIHWIEGGDEYIP